jgi:hypothetical protein
MQGDKFKMCKESHTSLEEVFQGTGASLTEKRRVATFGLESVKAKAAKAKARNKSGRTIIQKWHREDEPGGFNPALN